MTCTVACSRPLRRAKNTEVSGTWDYKWPRGSHVRIAFQRPREGSDKDFKAAITRCIELGQRWERGTAKYLAEHPDLELQPTDFARSCIAFDFDEDRVFDAPLGPKKDVPVGSEHRSPFVREELDRRDYDALVSLTSLPLVRHDPFRNPIGASSPDPDLAEEQFGTQRVLLPFAELGCYAKRVDYGQPTAFLGSPFKKETPQTYLDSVGGAHVIVHEFGHVLGLPHTHQSPQYSELSFRPAADLVKVFAAAFDSMPVSQRFVREQITLRWRGNENFSDWPVLAPLAQLSSVMAYPRIADLLTSSATPPEEIGKQLKSIFGKREALITPEEPSLLTHPSDTDIEMLLIMYGPPRVRKQLLKIQRERVSANSSAAPQPGAQP